MGPTVFQVTTTPGTPIQAVAAKTRCAMIWAVNLDATQVVSFGNVNLNRTTKVGVIGLLPPTSSGATPDSNILKLQPDVMGEDPYDASEYYFDSPTAAVVNLTAWIL